MEQPEFDVIIIGAGACGMMAARECALTGKSIAVVEARDRAGGRIQTIHDKGFELPVELGAEFIHGNLETTAGLLKKAGLEKIQVKGSFWQKGDGHLQEQEDLVEDYSDLEKKFQQLNEDLPVADFIENYLQEEKYYALRFSLKNYVEGYYAADTSRASTYAMRRELTTSDEEQFRVKGGYGQLITFLQKELLSHGGQLLLSSPVHTVNWQRHYVEVLSASGRHTAKRLLVTVPLGVLQREAIRFEPLMRFKMEASRELGFGPVVKTLVEFHTPFWKDKSFTEGKDLQDLGFIFSKEMIPTWWTSPKAALLTGWSGGPHALDIKDLTDEMILEQALRSLAGIFNTGTDYLQAQLKNWIVANWVSDPYCMGGYSYDVVGGEERKRQLLEPESGTVYFSGEGLFTGPEIGTVESALVMGRETAQRMIAEMK